MDIDRENQIRSLSLRFTRQDIQKFLLTEAQRELLFTISHDGITTPDLCKLTGSTSQAASMNLNRLVDMGYLTREEIPDPTGGYMYIYEKTPQVMADIRDPKYKI